MSTRFQDADGDVVDLDVVHAAIDHSEIAGGAGLLPFEGPTDHVDIEPADLGETFVGFKTSRQVATFVGTFPDDWWCRFVQGHAAGWRVEFPGSEPWILNGASYTSPSRKLDSSELGYSWTVMKLSGKWYLEPQGSELSAFLDPGGGV